jgi:pimeloyl-ACP methyl ester carboxylesterase
MSSPTGYTPAIQQAFISPFKGAAGRAALLRNLRWGRPAQMFAKYPEIIAKIKCPTLVVLGALDPYIPADQARRIVATVGDSRLVIVAEGSHFLPLDSAAQVANAVTEFVEHSAI